MSNLMQYKGYQGSVEYGAEDKTLFGKVQFIKSLLMYEGNTVEELEQSFHQVIDEYLEDCKAGGVEPNRPCSGVLNVRLGHQRHLAQKLGVSIDDLICEAVDSTLQLRSM